MHTFIPIVEELLLLKRRIEKISHCHIYKERNSMVVDHSKVVAQQAPGTWKITNKNGYSI